LTHIILPYVPTLGRLLFLTYHHGTNKHPDCDQKSSLGQVRGFNLVNDSSGGSCYWTWNISYLFPGLIRKIAYPATVSLMVDAVCIRREGIFRYSYRNRCKRSGLENVLCPGL